MGIDTFASDLLNYLSDRGYGTIGVDLLEGGLSLTVDNCIAIIPYEGTNPTTIKSGEDNPYNPYLSVLVRNMNKKQAYDTTVKIYKLWRLVPLVTIGTTRFELIKARGTWHPLGLDKNGAMIYSINFSLKFE